MRMRDLFELRIQKFNHTVQSILIARHPGV
jgi:hypothetical protein